MPRPIRANERYELDASNDNHDGKLRFKMIERGILVAWWPRRSRYRQCPAAALTAAEPDTRDPFQRHVMPLFERYCVDCHMNGESEGGIVLDRFANQEAAIKDGKIWIRVRDAIQGRIMPPADEPQPSIAELDQIVAWIEKDFLAAQCGKQVSSAPVVIAG